MPCGRVSNQLKQLRFCPQPVSLFFSQMGSKMLTSKYISCVYIGPFSNGVKDPMKARQLMPHNAQCFFDIPVPACLPVYISSYLYLCFCIRACLTTCLFVYLYTCLPVYLYICICTFGRPSISGAVDSG